MLFKYRHRVLFDVMIFAALGSTATAVIADDNPDHPPASMKELAPVVVSAEAEPETAETPVKGYVAKQNRVGSKTDTPLIETPQTVNTITHDQIEDQAAQTVNEALRYAPGVSSYGSSTRSDWYTSIRGFSPSTYLNGLQLPNTLTLASWVVDPYQLERIEILRGPASVLYGQGDPGATVNMVSKQPSDEAKHEIELQYGSNSRKQVAFDFTGPLNQDGTLAYRLIALDKEANMYAGPKEDRRQLFAPSISWRPSDDTTLTVSFSYLHDNTDVSDNFLPAEGTILPNPNGKISPSLFTGDPNFDQYKKNEWSLGYAFEHHFDSTWTVRQNLRYSRVEVNNNAVYGLGLDPADPTEANMARTSGIFNPSYGRFDVDTQLEGKFGTGRIAHTVLFGIDHQHQTTHDPEWYGTAPDLNMFNPVYLPIDLSSLTQGQDTHQQLDQTGIYLQDQIKFDKRWVVVLGGRADSSTTRTSDPILATNSEQSNHQLTYRAGLVYLMDNGLAPYVSYSTSFNPQLGTTQSGTPFGPTTGKQIEVGLHYQPAGKQSFANAALYRITQNNVLTTDPTNPNFSVETGQVRSEGLELSAVANISNYLNLVASYAYQDVKNTKANPSDGVDTQGLWPTSIPLPRQMASLWGEYSVHGGMLDGWGFGAGVRYSGSAAGSFVFGDNSLKIPAYTLIDAAIHYRTGPWRVALNIDNLTNKTYVTGCEYEGACFYGNARNATMTLSRSW